MSDYPDRLVSMIYDFFSGLIGNCTLQDPALESRFNTENLPGNIAIANSLFLITIIFHLLSPVIDIELFGNSADLVLAMSVRLFMVVLTVLTFLLFRINRNYAVFNNILTAWSILLLLSVLLVNSLYASDYTIYLAWDMAMALAVYTVVPLSIGRQMLIASVISLGDLLVFWHFKQVNHSRTLVDIAFAYLCANSIGIFSSIELHTWKRQRFITLQNEITARESLKQALQDVKTLEGILPICIHCKKIRNDQGAWDQIETYLRTHTDAQFSHGLCADCYIKHYPDYF